MRARDLKAIDLKELPEGALDLEGELPCTNLNARLSAADDQSVEFEPGLTFGVKLRYQEGILRLSGEVSGTASQSCSRCLEPMKREYASHFDLIFRQTDDESLLADDELALRSEVFNLEEALEDSLILQLSPFGDAHEDCESSASAEEAKSGTSLAQLLEEAVSKN